MDEIFQFKCKTFSQWIGKQHMKAESIWYAIPFLLFGGLMTMAFMVPFVWLGPLGTFPAGALGFMAAAKLTSACERDYHDLLVDEGYWSREDADRMARRS